LINADDNTIAGNRVTGSGDHGLFVASGSDNNAIRGNEFDSNGRRGILVSVVDAFGFGAPEDNRFEGNHATGNVLFDVRDQTIGDGTQGTDSTYKGTRCETSSPDGICVP
jgi:parallel beta-helix repeat protein